MNVHPQLGDISLCLSFMQLKEQVFNRCFFGSPVGILDQMSREGTLLDVLAFCGVKKKSSYQLKKLTRSTCLRNGGSANPDEEH